MPFTRLDDKHEIEPFLRQDIHLHIYSLGDLDDFFWPYTTFYGLRTNGHLDAVALLYRGQGVPALLALSNNHDAMAELLRSLTPEPPPSFYAHLSPGLEEILGETHEFAPHGVHFKMALCDRAEIADCDCSQVVRLNRAELEETLLMRVLPWLDERLHRQVSPSHGLPEGP